MPKNAIEAIIKRRNQKAEDFAQRKERYEGINEKVISIMRYREQMLNEDFQDATNRKLAGDNFINSLTNLDPTPFNEAYKKLKNSLNEVIRIYEKDEISISVIGERRQGKSQLLQSISGLPANIIPTSKQDDCTGAISVIKNKRSNIKNEKKKNDGDTANSYADVKVNIRFYNEEEMISQINSYIKEINDPILKEIVTLSEVKSLRAEEVLEKIHSDKEKAPLYEKCKQLTNYVKNYDAWSEKVEKYGQRGELFSVDDAEDIVKYVAQHNGKSIIDPLRREYCLYLAVKEAQIECPFVFENAGKIVLRDTIGFGDTKAVGLLDSMVKSVSEGCDAAIVVKRPDPVGAKLEDVDNIIYDALQKSAKERQLCMDDWCFYVLNHTEGNSDSGYGENITSCNIIRKTMLEENRACADIYIANVSKEDEVTGSFLIPMLGVLKENLPKLDAALEARIDKELEIVYDEYEKICKCCAEALSFSYEVKQNFENESLIGFSKRWASAIASMDNLEKEYASIAGEKCDNFQTAVLALAPRSNSGIVPEPAKILVPLKGGKRPQTLLESYMDKLRNDFTKKFVEMDDIMADLVANMQKKVCDILVCDFSLNKIVGCTPEDYGMQIMAEEGLSDIPKEIYSKWLSKLYDRLKEMFKNSTKYDDLFVAIQFIATFTISVRGFLMHKVRSSVNGMKPAEGNTLSSSILNRELARLNATNPPDKDTQIAQVIHRELVRLVKQTFDNVCEKVGAMFKDPNQLLYSAVAEFVDRVVYSYHEDATGQITQIDETWRDLYEEKEFKNELEQTYNKLKKLQENFHEIVDDKLTKEQFFGVK